MICRIWRGWTTAANVAAYPELFVSEIIPGIEARIEAGLSEMSVHI